MVIKCKQTCSDCIGVDNCYKYCTKKAGKNLADFLIGVDTCETEIGEIKKGYTGGHLIVTGHQLEGDNNAIIMREIKGGIKINSEEKIKSLGGKNALNVLKDYTDTLCQEKYGERISDVQSKIKKFNSNKLMAVPFKSRDGVYIKIKDGDKERKMDGIVTSVCWNTNTDTGDIEGQALVRHMGRSPGVYVNEHFKVSRIPLSNYGKEIILSNIERNLKTSQVQPQFISMTNEGIIKPIIIDDGKIKLAVDYRYMYIITDDSDVIIIGTWQKGGMVEHKNIGYANHSKAYRKLQTAIKFIENHRRFISPLGLIDSNIVKV